MTLEITVYGVPGPQGSKRFLGVNKAGRGVMIESSKKVKPWREAVKYAALAAMERIPQRPAIRGPVAVEFFFTLPKPKSAPKSRLTYPDRKPDVSKLVRSSEDALTEVGVWEDDARVVRETAAKLYPRESVFSLHSPGAVIRVMSMEEWEG